MSSLFEVGCPQEEQKRTLVSNSASQFAHLAMEISRSSLNQGSSLGLLCCAIGSSPTSEAGGKFCYHAKR